MSEAKTGDEKVQKRIERGEAEWKDWLLESLGDGLYFGWCPLHDAGKDPEVPTAKYDLAGGNFWCLALPRCTGKARATTLVNLRFRVADGAAK